MSSLVGRKLGVVTVLLTVWLSDCGQGKDGGTNQEKDGGANQEKEREAARILEQGPPTSPINITVQVDSSRETTEIIDATGGRLRVTGADGTKFTLELPKNAVPESTGITLRPVDSLSGLPFSAGLVGAVQLSPDGLVLSAPATLTIEAKRLPPPKDQVAFGAAGDGQGVHLVPLTRGSEQIRLLVLHFSIDGVVKSVPGALVFENGTIQWQEGFWPKPPTPLARLQQETTKHLMELRILYDLGYEPASSTYQEVYQRAQERIRAARFLYFQDLAQRLRSAAADCANIETAGKVIAEYYTSERTSAILAVGTSEGIAGLEKLVHELMDKCARQAWERCRAHEIKAGFDMLTIMRQYALIGWDSPYDAAQLGDLKKCPPFKLVIEDNSEVEIEMWKAGPIGVPKASEKSHHVYRGYLYLDKDSLWHGGVDVNVEGNYTTIDRKATEARLKQIMPGISGEKPELSASFEAIAEYFKFIGSDIPTCTGNYTGKQWFTIEGQFITDDQGQQQVELAFFPVKEPAFYRSTPSCPSEELGEIDGFKTLPVRLVKGQETAMVIDAPRQGAPPKKYVIPAQGEGFRAETIITVGGEVNYLP